MKINKLLTAGLLVVVAITRSVSASAQNISTLAGNGTAGYVGDDGPAIANEFWSPSALTIIGGTVFVADGLNNRVRAVSQTGVIRTIAGTDDPGNIGDGGAATDAELNNPDGIAADRHGNIYISDKYNNRVRRIDNKGKISAFAGIGLQGYSGDGGLAINAEFNAPAGIAVDTSGNVFIADAGNHCIREVMPDGRVATIAGNGTPGFSGDKGPASAARLNMPTNLIIDTAGNLFFTDSWNYRIREINKTGNIITIAGTGAAGFSGDGQQDSLAELNLPNSLVMDKAGNIYFTDMANNRIRCIASNGVISTLAGNGNAGYSGDGGPSLFGEMNGPAGLALDGNKLYIAEVQGNRIRSVMLPPPPPKAVKSAKNPGNNNNSNSGSRTTPIQNPGSGGYPLFNSSPSGRSVQTGAYNRRKGG